MPQWREADITRIGILVYKSPGTCNSSMGRAEVVFCMDNISQLLLLFTDLLDFIPLILFSEFQILNNDKVVECPK
jgi:hypothetical protein